MQTLTMKRFLDTSINITAMIKTPDLNKTAYTFYNFV